MTEKLKVALDDQPSEPAPLPPLSFSVSTMAVSFLSGFIVPKSARVMIRHLHMQPHPDGGVMLFATNGAAAAFFYDRFGQANRPGSITLSSKLLTACHASAKMLARLAGFENANNVPSFQLVVRDGRLCCTSMANEIHVDPLNLRDDGTPTWEMERATPTPKLAMVAKQIPNRKSNLVGPSGLMSPSLMTDVCKAFQRLGQSMAEFGILMHQPSPDSVNKVFQPYQDAAFVVMMPLRDNDPAFLVEADARNAWFKAIAQTNEGFFA